MLAPTKAIFTEPALPRAALLVAVTAASLSLKSVCASLRKARPAGVRTTLLLVRSKSVTSRSCSRSLICRLSGGCVIFKRRAARLKFNSVATATNERTLPKSSIYLNPVSVSNRKQLGLKLMDAISVKSELLRNLRQGENQRGEDGYAVNKNGYATSLRRRQHCVDKAFLGLPAAQDANQRREGVDRQAKALDRSGVSLCGNRNKAWP
ncbi:conserved hypothetical protein [Agrobacterium fabacearum TT111]|nr:conserved hypothetical protein [Agrobacterium fabacearum TT111]